MKEIEEIFKEVCLGGSGKEAEGYNILEMQGYNALKQVMIMYRRGEIGKEEASKVREKIYKEYREECREFSFMYEMYRKHLEDIKSTEMDRTELRKLLNSNSEVTDIARVAVGILGKVFPGEFY